MTSPVVSAAEYVVRGSLRRGTDTLTAWLRDARGGQALWREAMERPLVVGGIYAICDRIAVAALEAVDAANPAAAEVCSGGMAVAFVGDRETGLAYLAKAMRADTTYPRG